MSQLIVLCILGLVAYACGETASLGSKVVGGTNTNITNYPYVVSLQRKSHFCGGSIYNSRYIITAAHCVRAVATPSDIKIRYGSSYHASGGTVIGVLDGRVHPDFNNVTMENDIAVLKTNQSIVWSSAAGNASSIFMAISEPKNGSIADIVGWGTMQSGNSTLPTQLQAANVNILSGSICNSTSYGYKGDIGYSMICAAAANIDTCQGDSGGPLIFNKTQVGIVSWGSGCANAYYPGVYSSLAVLRSFITETVKLLSVSNV